ncbi:hypothetical protein B5P43_15575 [Bacillus sp. SRB_336]|nr:hypothetical protein B5P43_15575 [Bacillus sp. SRB_336]
MAGEAERKIGGGALRLEEYVPTAIARLAARVREHLAVGGEAAALGYLQKSLTMTEQVLGGDRPPAMNPPASVGDTSWDALISAALLNTLGPAWPEPAPLPAPWFPVGETGAARTETISATPATLARARIYIKRQDLRWPPPTAPLP